MKRPASLTLNRPQALFLDIDGTLYNKQSHSISDLTMYALHELKNNGVQIILNTARSAQEAACLPASLIASANGLLLLSGSIIDLCGKRQITLIEPSALKQLLAYINEKQLSYRFVDADEHDYLTHDDETIKQGFIRNYNWVPDIKAYEQEALIQLLVFLDDPKQGNELNEIAPDLSYVKLPKVCEITPKGCDKGAALRKACELLEIDLSQAAAVGDGASDIPMFEAVYGIAMGNSEDSVKAKADFIAESITDDGFYKAVKRLNWIE